ncbi:UDP-N-acetylmuramate--L-alanine ligase [Candidatus Daviesbacteria bacterium]|nr:UDP-N-acetylmuramate--L-alanine ligase [Candidatus Daviesbacteria bacterium]
MATKVHFLGIGGSGASGASAIAEAQGFEVTGCDLEPHNEFTTIFKPNQLFTGHNPKHLASHIGSGNVDILAVTPAIFSLDPNNPELVEAKEKGIPVITWQQFVGEYLTKNKFVIAICGTHGKTTTTAMIAKLLEDAGLDPTVLLGATIPKWGTNFRLPKQKHDGRQYFVVEADEFNDNFLPTKPDIAVVTNIEMDHPEYFKDLEAVKDSFKKFLIQTKKTVVANLTDPGAAEVVKVVMKEPKSQTSSDRGTNVQYLDYTRNELGMNLQIPGEFNRLNAKAAMQVGLLLGIEPATIKRSLENYTGASKRFEYIGQYKDAQVYSDFGHHPTEIEKTMEAAREKFPDQRILLIYQPHMFSRTKVLFNDFVKVFQKVPVDRTFVMDIYPSREVDTGLITSKQLVEAIQKGVVPKFRNSEKMVPLVLYIGETKQVLEKLKPEIKPGDIVFFMSAGDTDKLAKELVGGLK